MKRTISFMTGAGGNHIRWLLYPDKLFPHLDGSTNKVEYVRDHVYNEKRTWTNWLAYEHHVRYRLDEYLPIDHIHWSEVEGNRNHLALYMYLPDLDLALKRYYHINLGMNSITPETFKQAYSNWSEVDQYAKELSESNENIYFLNGENIFQHELDRNLYNKIIHFFKLDDHYDEAAEIHRLYNASKKKSAEDFVNYFKTDNFLNHIEYLKDFYQIKG